MELRQEIAPKMDIAEARYPEILQILLEYTDYCDEYGDEGLVEYKKMEEQLHQLTGKDMSTYNLYEWWEEEGVEVLAFRIALPDPERINDLSKEDLAILITKINSFEIKEEVEEELSYEDEFGMYLHAYYHAFLKLNCKKYNPKFFHRYKDSEGNYYEYSTDEILTFLINNK
ncbi:MAG: hypothetical protein LBE34_03425 [Flavobacteriaceae bacterium]|jgi:hypothetical protein|nr:hypothetical protein [Flavobacteriaceae bacterium]